MLDLCLVLTAALTDGPNSVGVSRRRKQAQHLIYFVDFRILDAKLHRFCRGNLRARDKLGRPRSRRKDDIKMDFKKHDIGVARIDLAQERDRWRALVNTVMNSWVP